MVLQLYQDLGIAIAIAIVLLLHYDLGIAIAIAIVLLLLLLQGIAIAIVLLLYYELGIAVAIAIAFAIAIAIAIAIALGYCYCYCIVIVLCFRYCYMLLEASQATVPARFLQSGGHRRRDKPCFWKPLRPQFPRGPYRLGGTGDAGWLGVLSRVSRLTAAP